MQSIIPAALYKSSAGGGHVMIINRGKSGNNLQAPVSSAGLQSNCPYHNWISQGGLGLFGFIPHPLIFCCLRKPRRGGSLQHGASMLMPYQTNCHANGNQTHTPAHTLLPNNHLSKHQLQRLATASDNMQIRQETWAEGTSQQSEDLISEM